MSQVVELDVALAPVERARDEEVVQRAHELPVPVDDRDLASLCGLRDDRACIDVVCEEVASLHVGRDGKLRESEQGRCDVEAAHRLGADSCGQARGRPQDQRDAEHRFPQTDVIEVDPVVAETFAMVGGQYHHEAIPQSPFPERVEQATELPIDVRDLAGIERPRVLEIADPVEEAGEVTAEGQRAMQVQVDRAHRGVEIFERRRIRCCAPQGIRRQDEAPRGAAADAEPSLEHPHDGSMRREPGAESGDVVEDPFELDPREGGVTRVARIAGVVGPVEGRWRRVGHVGIPDVYPGERAFPARSPQPGERPIDGVGCASWPRGLLGCVERIEPGQQRAEQHARAEVVGAHESGRAIAGRPKHVLDRLVSRPHRRAVRDDPVTRERLR